MAEFSGWLLDLYEGSQSGVVLWFVTPEAERIRLYQEFPVTFYIGGTQAALKQAGVFLQSRFPFAKVFFTQRQDLYRQEAISVLAVETQPVAIGALVRRVSKRFPDLDYYDADIPIAIRYAARYGTFPLAHCRVAHTNGSLQRITVLDTPWDLDPPAPPLRTLQLELDSDPRYSPPEILTARFDDKEQRIPIRFESSSLIRLNTILRSHDPDLLLTSSGDIWLLPHLLEMSKRTGIALHLNRDPKRPVKIKKEGSYFSYGRIVYRGQQALLFGRCHIDSRNSMLWQDYDLASALEMARVTRLPIQTAARCSPGTGINMMEVITALQQGVLVPWQKTHGEEVKTAYQLLRNDQGGLVYQPVAGVHENVGMIDFISLYPSIMTHCNISPELPVPKNLGNSPFPPGLIPRTLGPLLEKRVTMKHHLLSLPPEDPLRPYYQARASSLKMLLVCCFGYMGYKAAKFGRIESHEAISALGREALLRAKEAAEDMGFTVLHLYVDGIWVKKEGCREADDFTPLLNEIVERTSLPIALDSVYRWVAFPPSRQDSRLAVPNRYFGVKQDGSTTLRGIEVRKHDTPPYITRMQEDLLRILAGAADKQELHAQLPRAMALVQDRYHTLQAGEVRPVDLVVHKRMSKELSAYRVRSAAAIAAQQLEDIGQPIRLGQRVPLVYTLGKPGASAWHERIPLDPRSIHYAYYGRLLVRAANAVLQPLRVDESTIREYARSGGLVSVMLLEEQEV
ncbi:MAG: polymerase [Chloroflexota bacterium]|nr:polymerase [Chloroflexota bacterium]